MKIGQIEHMVFSSALYYLLYLRGKFLPVQTVLKLGR